MQDTSWFTQSLLEKLAEIRSPARKRAGLEELTARERGLGMTE